MARQLIDLVPLVRDDLSDVRYELHKSMIESVVSGLSVGDYISENDLKNEVRKRFSLNEFPKEILYRVISEFENAGILKAENNRCRIVKKIELDSIDLTIYSCYKEFGEILIAKFSDFDIYINKDYSEAFRDCMDFIINMLIDEQNTINRINVDWLRFDTISEELGKILQKYTLSKKKELFLSSFFEYLASGKPSITRLLFIVYRFSVAYDLLKRGRELPRIAEYIGEGGLLLLDTNVIVSLMCKTDRTYNLAKSVVELAQNMFKLRICYYEETAKEFENLLRWADAEKNSGHLANNIHSENQLLQDYIKRGGTWSDYYTEISFYREHLKERYEIDIYSNIKVNFNDDEKRLASTLEVLYSTLASGNNEGKKERTYEALRHDEKLLRLLIFLKKKDMRGINAPWILSFDNVLHLSNQAIIKMNRLDVPEGGYSLHPRTLLNTFLVFSNIDFNENKRQDVVRSIVNYMILPPDSLTEEQYVKLLTYKVPGLNEKEDSLIRFLRISPLKSQLDRALKNNDLGLASEITKNILIDKDAVKAFASISNEENTRLKEAIRSIRTEKEELEEKIRSNQITFNISINGIDPVIRDLINVLLSRTNKLDSNLLTSNNINNSNDIVTKDQLSKIISQIEHYFNKGGDAAKNFQALIGVASLIKNYLGL